MSVRGTAPECRHVWELIGAVGDTEPTQAAVDEILDHFARCASCLDAEASLEDVLSLYREQSANTNPLPPQLEQKLLELMCMVD